MVELGQSKSSHDSVGRGEQGGDSERYKGRYAILVSIGFLFFLALLGRLWFLQVIRGDEFWRVSTENIIRDIEISPARGRIFDTSGVTLADNRPSFDVYVVPLIFNEYSDQGTLEKLRGFLNLTPGELVRIEKGLERKVADLVVRRDITRSQVAQIEAHQLDLPGVEVRVNAHRYYPFHSVGAHTVGFLGEIGQVEQEELEKFGYRSGDYIGRMGLERAYESALRGSPGVDRVVVDAAGNRQGEAQTEFLIGEYQHVAPVAGRDLTTTLDIELMLIIEEAMRDKAAGSVVALDPRDGSVLALYSKPGFNPNSWTGRLSTQEKRRNDSDPYKPMIDKSVNSYFPGSVYKVVGSLAALEEGLMQRDDEAYCPGFYRFGGRRFRCWKRAGHGHTDVVEALAGSCDVYYYKAAEQLGIDKLAEYSYRFGFGEVTGIGINSESAGRVPTKEWHRKNSPDGYQYGFALNTVIGQGDTLVSPLQMALAYAAIANGGDLYYPRLLKSVSTRDGDVLFDYAPRRRKRIDFDPKHLEAIRQGLHDAVNIDGGTAYSVRLEDVIVAGKTGTAQVHKIGNVRVANENKEFRFRDHAWFASYAPYENPELVVIVFLKHGGHGGSDAAPVAMEIYRKYFDRDLSSSLTQRVSELAAARERIRVNRDRAGVNQEDQAPDVEHERYLPPIPDHDMGADMGAVFSDDSDMSFAPAEKEAGDE